MAVLAPACVSVFERAHRVTCQNNHRQLIVGCMAYTEDWRMYLPFCNPRSDNGT